MTTTELVQKIIGNPQVGWDLMGEANLTTLSQMTDVEIRDTYKIPLKAARALAWAFELGRRGHDSQQDSVLNASTAARWFHDLSIQPKEHFRVLFLDARKKVIKMETISVGIVSQTFVHPREVFQPAILCNASSIILGHNHPSGDPTPSPEDYAVTERLAKSGHLIGIAVDDHIIVSRNGYSSIRAMGGFNFDLAESNSHLISAK